MAGKRCTSARPLQPVAATQEAMDAAGSQYNHCARHAPQGEWDGVAAIADPRQDWHVAIAQVHIATACRRSFNEQLYGREFACFNRRQSCATLRATKRT